MLTIAVVEDNDALRDALSDLLEGKGYVSMCYASPKMFWESRAPIDASVFVLDLNLPDEDGLTVAQRIREARPDIGIIILTARDSPQQRQLGYDAGADIYLPKPSSPPELLGAITALTRRVAPLLAVHPVVLYRKTQKLSGPSETVDLAPTEADLLAALASIAGQTLSFDEIARILDPNANPSKATLEVRIVRLRKKLTLVGAGSRSIVSVRKIGYRLCVPVHVAI